MRPSVAAMTWATSPTEAQEQFCDFLQTKRRNHRQPTKDRTHQFRHGTVHPYRRYGCDLYTFERVTNAQRILFCSGGRLGRHCRIGLQQSFRRYIPPNDTYTSKPCRLSLLSYYSAILAFPMTRRKGVSLSFGLSDLPLPFGFGQIPGQGLGLHINAFFMQALDNFLCIEIALFHSRQRRASENSLLTEMIRSPSNMSVRA